VFEGLITSGVAKDDIKNLSVAVYLASYFD
jgi:hypothetical protein